MSSPLETFTSVYSEARRLHNQEVVHGEFIRCGALEIYLSETHVIVGRVGRHYVNSAFYLNDRGNSPSVKYRRYMLARSSESPRLPLP